MAQTNEEPVTMDDNNAQNDEDNSSLGEWTILDKISYDKVTNKRSISYQRKDSHPEQSDEVADAEVAREAIQVLEQTVDTKDDINRIESFVRGDENSDGVSVISECDNNNDKSQLNNISNIVHSVEKNNAPVGKFAHIILACSLAAAIGFGIGCIVGKGETQLSVNDVNFGHAESEKYIPRSEQLSREIIMDDARIQHKTVLKTSNIHLGKLASNEQQPMNINDNNNSQNVGSLRDILERVKVSLDTLCTMIDDSYKSSESNEYIAVCAEPTSIMNLIELKSNIENVIMDIGYINDPSNKWFIENMEFKLKNVSLSLINDLSRTVKDSVMKIDRKLNKVRRKLNERLCLIRNTVGSDVKIQETLKKYNILEENCPTKKLSRESSSEFDLTNNSAKKKKFVEKNRAYPVGPEVKLEIDSKIPKVDVEFKEHRKNEKVPKDEQEKFYKSKRDYYKQRKDFSKGDFTNEREAIELQKYKAKKIPRPNIVSTNFVKNLGDEEIIKEEYCDANSCSKQRNNDRKIFRDGTYENWQFKRSEGRFNWREEKKVGDNDESSWTDKRAKGRKNAREKY
ncbi:hypothetical protein PV328_010958 [Microctonus aethiopoides]|uniref:Uncharacterized protein n=1 Tax=Microctonus aethiopoides TaxID=144406 RepID=A0AA39FJ47_9HYME|nr:hypothetical protein PV328_010958 [Microctonus aethiopoides]